MTTPGDRLRANAHRLHTKRLGGMAESATYHRDTGAIEQSGEDGVVTRPPSDDISITATAYSFTNEEINASGGAILPSDVKLMFSATEFGAGLQPTPNDMVTRADGTRWTVQGVTTNSSKSTWYVQLRAP